MAGAAAGPDEDAICGAGRAGRAGLFCRQEHRQRDAQTSERADLEEAAAIDAVAVAGKTGGETKHGKTPVWSSRLVGRFQAGTRCLWAAGATDQAGFIVA